MPNTLVTFIVSFLNIVIQNANVKTVERKLERKPIDEQMLQMSHSDDTRIMLVVLTANPRSTMFKHSK